MLTEDEIYCNEQMDLKHSETGKISKIILFIFTISWAPPSQPRKLKITLLRVIPTMTCWVEVVR